MAKNKKPQRRGCRGCLTMLGILLLLVVAGGVAVYLSMDRIMSKVIQSQIPEGTLDELARWPPPPTPVEREIPVVRTEKTAGSGGPESSGPWVGGRQLPGAPSEPEDTTKPTEPLAHATSTPPAGSGAKTPTEPPVYATSTPPAGYDGKTATPPPQSSAFTGRIAFTRNRNNANQGHEIFVLDLESGDARQITNNNASDWIPSWSPDGESFVFTSNRWDNYDIWVVEAIGQDPQPVITLDAWDEYPSWSPDWSRIAFISTGETQGVSNSELFVRLDSNEVKRLTNNQGRDEWPSWSPDSSRIAVSSDRHGTMDIFTISSTGGHPIKITDWAGFEEQPAWSPDGNWIAFINKTRDTDGNGTLQRIDDGDLGTLWIIHSDGSGARQLTFEDRYADPAWAPDGRHIVVAAFQDSSGNGHLSSSDNSHLWAIPLADGEPMQLTFGDVQDRHADWTR